MASDPKQLRPSEVCRLFNSTPLGEVLNDRQLHRHRMRAGMRIGDDRRVDLLRYIAWLASLRHAPKPEPEVDPYEALKERARARSAALSLAGRDIGELPDVADPARKARAAGDFRFFCEAYFAETFHLPWSPDHVKVIAKIEQAVLRGGLFAVAMPRGSGKTTLTCVACLWAVLHGHRRFVSLVAASADRARALLGNMKVWFESNALLAADYPEVIYPIHKLGRITNRSAGQLYRGEPTRMEWTADKIVLPTIEGSQASGAVLSTSGMKGGEIRGQNHALPDGQVIRPELAVIDDPQTRESAWSPSQSAQREAILAGDILGMAAPGTKISALMCCTVIRPGDMADNILDREKHPEWNGERTKMVYSFPSDEKLWERYAEVRGESFRGGGHGEQATDFYRDNRAAMDAGAVVAWPQRYNHDELSALQHAMNLKLRDEAAFAAEYQNEPLPEETGAEGDLTADQIAAKTNNLRRGEVPIACNHVTMFIDVQGTLLYYVVAAWSDDFTGYVLDYGSYPDQQRPYFTLRDARHTLALAAKGAGLEGSIYAGLEALTEDRLRREWPRDDGAMLRIERCLIDANWGNSTDVVYEFCRRSKQASVVMPSHGRFVGASSQPFSEYQRKPGDRVGHNWRVRRSAQGARGARHVTYDTNYWKSFVYARLAVSMGDRGCLSLFGDRPAQHRMFAEHLVAEYRVKTQGRGRTVDEWKQRPERADNHWFDCLVGCAVAASMQGAVLPGVSTPAPHRRQTVSFAEWQRQSQRRRRV